ncbi:hypothetical protein VKI22_04235 [Cyanobacterium aponinum UTEX 3221]|uniref:Uncharacterized protein n=1 Tax=Cyanobacterium aponinum 0216 TaxID=2676140 RepID=A0A844GRB8_9CHRO|nr:hypothetical protein [Cyanobacterium aponinum]MTF37602.1 hypothetical protein [Cyanobacterium aponinum 0216]WRL39314.1 hypothetical protein VKI22_04235 [Cyanobacterium aponinum UTEX 3221]
MKAKEFEHKFDQGEDITPYLDLTQAKRPLKQLKLSSQQKQSFKYLTTSMDDSTTKPTGTKTGY